MPSTKILGHRRCLDNVRLRGFGVSGAQPKFLHELVGPSCPNNEYVGFLHGLARCLLFAWTPSVRDMFRALAAGFSSAVPEQPVSSKGQMCTADVSYGHSFLAGIQVACLSGRVSLHSTAPGLAKQWPRSGLSARERAASVP